MRHYDITNMYFLHIKDKIMPKHLNSTQFHTKKTWCFWTDQELILVLGFEHGGHLLQIPAVMLLLQVRQEEDGDDPLCDVGEVEVIVPFHHMLHHLVCTFSPGETIESLSFTTVYLTNNSIYWIVCAFISFYYLGMELLFFCGVDLMEPCWGATRNIKQGSATLKILRTTREFTHSPGPV